MKRRNVTIIIVLLALFMAGFLWRVSDSNPLESIIPDDIKEMAISSPVDYFTVTEANDIELLFSYLQSMQLRRTINSRKDGFAFLIDIELADGEKINVSVLSEDVHIDGRSYRPGKDPSDDIRNVYDRLAEKDEENPS